MSTHRRFLLNSIIVLAGLSILSGVLTIWMPVKQAFQVIFGLFLIFIPGLPWTYVILKKVGLLERLLATIAFSIVFIPLTMFAADKVGIKPSPTSILVEILIITALGVTFVYFKKLKNKQYV